MWNDLSIRHFQALRAVAEEGTFGRAAARLGFTQSAVSQQIASLEQTVGLTLFDRPAGPRRPQLTQAGKLLLEHGEILLEQINRAEQDLNRYARGVAGHLVIGTFQSISSRVLPSALRQLREIAPDVEVTLAQDDAEIEHRASALARGDIDLAFVVGRPSPDVDGHFLGADPLVAMVPANHSEGPIDLRSLAASPTIGQPKDDACCLIIERELERLGVNPNYVFRSHDNGAVQGMVSAGVGVAIVPILTADLSDPSISVRPTIPELPPRELSLVWGKGQTLSPIARAFVTIVTEICSEMFASAPPASTGIDTTTTTAAPTATV